jgi:Rrf2 family iron-sulfur cluster assembly transcriptional regulator
MVLGRPRSLLFPEEAGSSERSCRHSKESVMKITALEEYGLRCLVVMAGKPDGESVTVAEIADGEGLTVPYVGKLMAALRQAGFVESVRGRGGGYVLARPAAEISVEEILNALGEPLFTTEYCDTHPGALSVCAHQGDCSIRSVWQTLGEIIHRVLRGTSLADLCMQEARLTSRFRESLPDALLTIGTHHPAAGAASGGACCDTQAATVVSGHSTMAEGSASPARTTSVGSATWPGGDPTAGA